MYFNKLEQENSTNPSIISHNHMAKSKEQYNEERKIRHRIDKQKSDEYRILLKNNQIQLIQGIENILCYNCNKSKLAHTDNFYLRLIRLVDGNFIALFNTMCINCETIRGKERGKLYNDKKFENETGMRKCKKCGFIGELNVNNFRFVQDKYFRRVCLACDRKEANIDTQRRKSDHPESIALSKRKYQSNRRKRDPVYKMRKYVSTAIYKILRDSGGNKNGKSILDFLPYSINDLVYHIENLFKLSGNEWMNWNNIGRYNSKTWNDLDQSTWKWNLDHIIPQSLLPYVNMEDENFRKCWSLSNLRPYSAKLNVLEGNRRLRKS